MKTKKSATWAAKRLKARTEKEVGGKWKIRVWENLGWWYEITCGSMSISENRYDYWVVRKSWPLRYSCMISDFIPSKSKGEMSSGTPVQWYDKKGGKTPKHAVDRAMKLLWSVASKTMAVYRENKALIVK